MQCDWYYCLKMMENGRADIISAALKKPEREKYMVFVEPPYLTKSTKLFYLPKGKGRQIKRYEDIYKYTIGVLRGSAYFDRFDNDVKIQKVEVMKTQQLLLMLKNGRIDAFAGTERVTDYLINSLSYEGLFEKSEYRYESEMPYYFAISKKSPFIKKISQFKHILEAMLQEGRVQTIIDKYAQ